MSIAPPVQAPAQPAQPPQAPAAAPDDEEPAAPPPPARKPRRAAPPAEAPPVVVYQPVPEPPPQVIVVTPGYGGYARPARQVPPPPPAAPPRPRWKSEFGLNLRVEGAALGHASGYGNSVGMGGVGLSLRYRPVPHFAFDIGVDVLAGNDYNGYQRVEVPMSLNGLIYLNPRSRVQVYLMGGMHLSRAQVKAPVYTSEMGMWGDGMYKTYYTYFGGQGGGGLEFRLSKHVALNLDVLGFVRKRIDPEADRTPEFVDPDTGRTTNTSGGALIRGGLVFWW